MRLVIAIFWRYAKKRPGLSAFLAMLIAGMTVLWIIEPLFTSYAIDRITGSVQGGESGMSLRNLGLLWALLFIALSVFGAVEKYTTWYWLHREYLDIRESIYENVLKLDVAFHISNKTGEVVQRLDQAGDEVYSLHRTLIDLLPSMVSSLVFLVISMWIQPVLATVLYVGILLYIFVAVFLSTKNMKIQEKVNDLWAASTGRASDVVMNIFTVKSSSGEHRELSRMHELDWHAHTSQMKMNKRWALLEAVNFYTLIRIALVAIGTYLLAKGRLTLGELYYFQFTFFRTLTPFEMLSALLPSWNKSVDKIRRGEEMRTKELNVKNVAQPQTLRKLKGNIVFDQVHFSYGEIAAIHDFTLEVKPGEHIAFVGHSGAGKSTMAMLINRFYDVTGGAITIDGIDLKELDMHWWRAQVGLVLQENITFNDSVLENIRYSRPDATDREVKEAAKRASAHEFILKLPQGYDTQVGERGVRLSGGERQRLAIARAILKKPAVVVLDEATSALDSITERQVQEGIKELIKGRTSFIIAHRLSTVRAVDRIAVMDRGKLVACAPHDELLKISPQYKHMVELQQQGMLAE